MNLKWESHCFFDKIIEQSTIVDELRLAEILQSAGSSQYCTTKNNKYFLICSCFFYVLFFMFSIFWNFFWSNQCWVYRIWDIVVSNYIGVKHSCYNSVFLVCKNFIRFIISTLWSYINIGSDFKIRNLMRSLCIKVIQLNIKLSKRLLEWLLAKKEIVSNDIQLWDFDYGQKPYYEAKCWFSRGHFTTLEYCQTSAYPKTFTKWWELSNEVL